MGAGSDKSNRPSSETFSTSSREMATAVYFFSADVGSLNGVLWTLLVIAPLRMH